MKINFRDHVLPVLMFLVTITIGVFFSRFGIDPLHDGTSMKPAMDIVNGKMLLKESFSCYGPYWIELMAIVLKMGGNLYTARLLTCLFYGFISILLYFLWKRLMPTWAIIICFLCYSIMTPNLTKFFYNWPSVYTSFFTVLVICLFVSNFEIKKYWKVILAGLITSFSLWIKQPMIIFIYVGMTSSLFLVYLMRNKILPTYFEAKSILKDIFIYTLSTFGSIPVFASPLIISGNLGHWYQQNILAIIAWNKTETSFVVGNYNFIQKAYLSLFPMMTSYQYTFLVFTSVVFLLFVFVKYNIFDAEKKEQTLIPIFIVMSGLGFWLQNYPYSVDKIHMYWAGMVLYGSSFYALLKMLEIQKTKRATNIIFAIACMFFVFIAEVKNVTQKTIKRLTYENNTINEPYFLKNIKVSKEKATKYEKLIKAMNDYDNNYPNGSYVNLTPEGLFSCFTKSKTPTILWSNFKYINDIIVPEWETKMKDYAIKNKTMVIATSSYYDYFKNTHRIVFDEDMQTDLSPENTILLVPK